VKKLAEKFSLKVKEKNFHWFFSAKTRRKILFKKVKDYLWLFSAKTRRKILLKKLKEKKVSKSQFFCFSHNPKAKFSRFREPFREPFLAFQNFANLFLISTNL